MVSTRAGWTEMRSARVAAAVGATGRRTGPAS